MDLSDMAHGTSGSTKKDSPPISTPTPSVEMMGETPVPPGDLGLLDAADDFDNVAIGSAWDVYSQSLTGFFHILKAADFWRKTQMALNSDIDRLTSRVNRLCRTVSLPRIDMIVWHEGEDPPATKPWNLRIMIERRD